MIDFEYLNDATNHDLAVLTDAFEQLRDLAATEPLASAIAGEAEPGFLVQDQRNLEKYIRKTVEGYSHPVGTCRMGPEDDPGAVVDSNGRVYGAENVFVADASIIPPIPRANINLLCFLIGWKVGGMLIGQV